MGTPTKMNGDEEQLVNEALEHAEGKKTKGNSLFKEGKHSRAAEEYHNSLNELQKLRLSGSVSSQPEVTTLTVALHSNLTACHLAMGQYKQAAAEAQAALALDPLHTKAHFRLCKAMYELGRFDKAARAILGTVALTLPDGLDSAMLELFVKVGAAGNQQAGEKFKLPFDMIELQSIVCVASNTELHSALSQGKSYVVLKPGSYTLPGPLTVKGSLALIGVGKVELRSGEAGHALHVKSGEVYACNLELVGNAKKSVVCVAGANAVLSLDECVVQDHKNVGVLIVKGEAMLDRCSFTNIEKQALEVRPSGTAQLKKCFISKCHQGVLMHGGARKVNIFGCEIKDTAREGVLVCGERQPWEWGPMPTLQILSSVVTCCGYNGLSLDKGICPVIGNSVFVNNSPFAISVQGFTTCIIAGCHFETGNRSGGLCVTSNHYANVYAKDCTFVVPVWKKIAIVQDGSTILPIVTRITSKPVTCKNNHICVGTLPEALTLEELEMREGPGIGTLMHSRDAYLQSKNHLTLVRTSRHLGHNLQKAGPVYPVGNTFGYDLSSGQDLSANERQPIRILLGACGDIRNLVKTVSALDSRPHSLGMLQVVLNDNNVVILARDVLLLSLIAQRTAAEDVIAIWANHALKSFQHKLLNDALATLAISLPEWLVLPVDCNLAAELLDVFASWRDCTMTLQGLLDMRRDLQKRGLSPYGCSFEVRMMKLIIGAWGGRCEMPCSDEELKRHITSGNVGHVTKEMQCPNPTLLGAPGSQYYTQVFTSIYRAISINVDLDCALYEILLKTVTPQLKAVADVFERGLLRVAVDGSDIVEGMLCGGFLRLLRQLDRQPSPSASPILFDFIDLSNVSDHVSIPAVVQAALPLLKIAKHATIHAQSMKWTGVFPDHQPSPFLCCTTGMDVETYRQLLGVKVQTQVVGCSQLLQTQWTWDLGTEEPWLTGVMLVLEMMAAAKLYCGIDRAHYVSEVCKGARMWLPEPGWGGIESASPLTMLHLLHLASPNIVMPIVRILVTTNDEYRKREWELVQHAQFQKDIVDPNSKGGQLVKLVFEADADFYSIDGMPLCLAVSKVTLRRGMDVANTDVLQVFEAISYFAESDLVEVMLQRALAENPKHSSYFMTLCVAADCTKLQAVGTSVPWSKLSIEPLTGLPRWTDFEGLGKRSLLSDDLELLELIVKQFNYTSTSQAWETHAVFETARFVVVELLLPRPFPGADEVAVAVTSSGASMTVTTRALHKQKGKGKGKKRFGFPETHDIRLPTTVRSDGHRMKMSRKLGLMTMRLFKTDQT